MMRIVINELQEFALQWVVWGGGILLCLFLTYAVSNLDINKDQVSVAFYVIPSNEKGVDETIRAVREVARELAIVAVLEAKPLQTDIATQMVQDDVDIAVTRTTDGWRLTLKSRSALEHQRLVRVAQVLGATIAQRQPWFMLAYSQLGGAPEGNRVHVSGITVSPGPHSSVYVAKIACLLSYFMAFAIVCRSMVRDLSSNVLLVQLASSRGNWIPILGAKLIAGAFYGLMIFAILLLFASVAFGVGIKLGLATIFLFQTMALLSSALVGLLLSLLARTEARLYFIAFSYLILLLLLSGLIARIGDEDRLLQGMSFMFPINYAMDATSNWLFFGSVPKLTDKSFSALMALLILSGVSVYISAMIYRRNS